MGSATRPRELSELEQQRPELLPWLRPLRVALDALATEPWGSLAPLPAPLRDGAAPALHGAVVPLEPGAARAHVHAVLAAALTGSARREGWRALEPVSLLEAAVAQDEARIGHIAAAVGVGPERLAAAAQLAALPLLHAAARTLAPAVREDWHEPYCHVCGALPLLAEAIGLERARHLRCGRCGAGWRTQVLLCPYCDERDHARLGSLVPDGPAGQVCWVETCTSCRTYWKARAVLRAAPADTLLLDDARTLELDVAAHERGFERPRRDGFQVRLRIAPVAAIVS